MLFIKAYLIRQIRENRIKIEGWRLPIAEMLGDVLLHDGIVIAYVFGKACQADESYSQFAVAYIIT